MSKPSTPQLPCDLDAERALLGVALIDTDALLILTTDTRPEDFFAPAHTLIADALRHHCEQGIAVDPVTVADTLRRRGLLDKAGGIGTLSDLFTGAPVPSSAPRYAQIVCDHAVNRRLIQAAAEIAQQGHVDAHEAVVRAQELIEQVAASNGRRSYSTLYIADIAALIAAGLPEEQPAFLTRLDGQKLLYEGRMHAFFGEPGCGKSWLALHGAAEILDLGGSVLYLDYEDTDRGIVGRMLSLGADPDAVVQRFRYVRPEGPIAGPERLELEAMIAELNPDVVVIDGVAEALSRAGYDEDKAAQVVAWAESLPRWIARSGAAVVMIDHVTKDRERRGGWQRGSGAKKAMIDGAAYEVVALEHFSKQRPGRSNMVISKDRPGGVGPERDVAATAFIEPHANGAHVAVRLDAPQEGEAFMPTLVMSKVSKVLEDEGAPMTATSILERVPEHQKKTVHQAINNLRALNLIREVREGRSRLLVFVAPFTPGKAPAVPRPASQPQGLFDNTDPGNVTDLDDWKRKNF